MKRVLLSNGVVLRCKIDKRQNMTSFCWRLVELQPKYCCLIISCMLKLIKTVEIYTKQLKHQQILSLTAALSVETKQNINI